MNNKTWFTQYEDPGHSWLEVPYSLLKELGIEKKITTYSFRKGNLCYLEEDCDWSTFHDAMKVVGREYSVIREYSEEEPPCCSFNGYFVS